MGQRDREQNGFLAAQLVYKPTIATINPPTKAEAMAAVNIHAR
jgi:hypothetical protein